MKLGKSQKLLVKRKVQIGAYVGTDYTSQDEDILLPTSQITKDIEEDDEITVFIYKDSEDRLIATMRKPYLEAGEVGILRVSDVTDIGAFLDWGLDKDLLVPFREQLGRPKEGEKIIVAVYVDKTRRLCATMKIYGRLSTESSYEKEEPVEGVVYDIDERLGAFVAVDGKYHGLVQKQDLIKDVEIGETLELEVVNVREDGKLNLSLRGKAYKYIDKDAEKILNKLIDSLGFLKLHDKSSPDEIRSQLDMSKNSFKKAIGRLYKEKKISITDSGIKLIDKE